MQVQQREGSIAMLRIHRSRRHFAVIAVAGSLAVGILGAGLFGSGFFAAGPALAGDPVFSEDGLAIHAYDPVASFTDGRSEEPPSELPSTMRTSYAVFCLHKEHTVVIPHSRQHNALTLS